MQENKMGTMPVGKLLLTMSLPMIVSMLVQALYNVVDTYFVSQISIDAVTALSNAFPIQNLMIGVATGCAVGMNALLSKSLGEKNHKLANKVAANGAWLAIVGFAIFLVFGLFFTRIYMDAMTDMDTVAEMGADYLAICCVFSFGIFGEILFERLMQSTGRTVFTMFTQGVGAIINIVLDPILIKGWGAIPAMGVKGAAWATVIGQIAAFLIAIVLNQFFNKEIALQKSFRRPDFKMCGKIMGIGFPSIIMVAIGSLMTVCMNQILKGIDVTEVSVAVFGIYYKLQSFVFMPIFGLNNGFIPIVAFNYGAQNRKRMVKVIRYAVITAVCIMTIGLVLFQLIPDKLLMIFKPENGDVTKLLDFGVPALRIISICFPVAAVCIIMGSVFQALGKSINSMMVSIARQLLVLIPVALLLSLSGSVAAVWWAFPIAEVASLIASVLLFIILYKKMIKPIPEGAD
ncbi:MAG: MATE family efflux transporter [Clostridia bacterium]|nr:MATE family efflux transporter [Clostridia bacterium]